MDNFNNNQYQSNNTGNTGMDPNMQYNNGMAGNQNQQYYNNEQFAQPDNMNNMNSMNGYGNNQYNNGYYNNNMQTPQSGSQSVIALVLSILSIVCCCGPFTAIPGLIVGLMAKKKNPADSKATASVIISIIGLVLFVIGIIVQVATGAFSSLKQDKSDSYNSGYEADINDPSASYEEDLDSAFGVTPDDADTDTNTDTDGIDANTEETVEQSELNTEESSNSDTSSTLQSGTDKAGSEVNPLVIVVNGIKVDMSQGLLPADVEKLFNIEFDEEDLGFILNESQYKCITYKATDNWDTIEFDFLNDTSEAKPVSECKLMQIELEANGYLDGDTISSWATFDIGAGLTEKSTADDFKAVLGDPDYTYESESYDSNQYDWYKQYGYDYLVRVGSNSNGIYSITAGLY